MNFPVCFPIKARFLYKAFSQKKNIQIVTSLSTDAKMDNSAAAAQKVAEERREKLQQEIAQQRAAEEARKERERKEQEARANAQSHGIGLYPLFARRES